MSYREPTDGAPSAGDTHQITLDDVTFHAHDVARARRLDGDRTMLTFRDGASTITKTPYPDVISALSPPRAAFAAASAGLAESDQSYWPGVKTWFGDALYQAGDDGPDGRSELLAQEGDDLHSRTLRDDQRQRVVARCRELAAKRDERDASDAPEAGESWSAQTELRYPLTVEQASWSYPRSAGGYYNPYGVDDPYATQVEADEPDADDMSASQPGDALRGLDRSAVERVAKAIHCAAVRDPRSGPLAALQWRRLSAADRRLLRRQAVSACASLLRMYPGGVVKAAEAAGWLDDRLVSLSSPPGEVDDGKPVE